MDVVLKLNERNFIPTKNGMLICVTSDFNEVFGVSFLFPLTSDHMGKIQK